jgi:hypothetical protein
MRDADPFDDARAVEPDRCVRQVVQVADAAAEQDRHQVDTELVNQAGVETPLGEVGAAERHDLVACMGLGLGDRLLDAALGDERERRVRTWPAVGDRVPTTNVCTPSGGLPSQPLDSSNVRRPTTRAPTRARWTDVQNGFVDASRQAVEQADGLVAELMQHLARTFSEERGKLESQWDRGDEIPTDDLRTAFQRYRSFFERLLAT